MSGGLSVFIDHGSQRKGSPPKISGRKAEAQREYINNINKSMLQK